MSLRHWEAVRDAVRATLREELEGEGIRGEDIDAMAGRLATAAIEAHDNSIYKTFRPEPHDAAWQAP